MGLAGLLLVLGALLLYNNLHGTASSKNAAPQSFDGESIRDILAGASVTYPNGATASWDGDGGYYYLPGSGGRAWRGHYTTMGENVCAEFYDYYGENLGSGWGGMVSCFRVVRRGPYYMLVDRSGRSFTLVPRQTEPAAAASGYRRGAGAE